MSNAYNHATVVGNLCEEPNYMQSQSGVGRATFRVGVQRRYKDRDSGQRKADFISVVAWRQTADFVRQYIHKGDLVVIDGEIQSRSYDAPDGTKRYVTEINAEDVRRPYQKPSEGTGNGEQGTGNREQGTGMSGDFTEIDPGDELPF